LHLGRELLDVAIVERFIRDVVLCIHQGSRGRKLRQTRCGGRLVLWTPCWAFLGCHRTISLWTHEVSRDRAYFYDTPWCPPCHRAWRGFAFPSCLGVSCTCHPASPVIECAYLHRQRMARRERRDHVQHPAWRQRVRPWQPKKTKKRGD
jgi:hypothetical protein